MDSVIPESISKENMNVFMVQVSIPCIRLIFHCCYLTLMAFFITNG